VVGVGSPVGVTVVGVAVGVSWQVQVGEDVGDGGAVYVEGGVVVGWSPPGDVDASAECETNSTVRLVTASAVLANPAIFPRFVIFKAVTPPGLRQKIGRADSEAQAACSSCHRAVLPWCPTWGTPGRNATER
jgi:hypothetical protein